MLVATLPFARTRTCYTSSSTFIDLFHSLTANFSIEKTFRSSVIQLGLHSSIISSTLLASKDSIQTKNTTIPKTSYFVNLVNGLRKQPWRHSEGNKHTFQRHSGLYYIGDQLQIKSETSNFDCFGAPQASLNQNLTQHKSLALRTPKFVFLLSPTSLKGGRSEKEILVSGRFCVDSGFVDAEVIAALTQMFGWLSGDVPLIPAQSGQKDADCREPDDTDDCEATKKSKALELVLLLVKQHAIVVFSKTYCPYCRRAKSVFEDLQVKPFVLELDLQDDGEHIQQALFRVTGSKTVPQVFIDNDFIGGSDDLVELRENGELKKILYWQSARADATTDSDS